MSEFVYLYRRSATPPSESPQQMQERMQRWQAWFKDLEKNGHLANYGQPLEDKGGGVLRDKKGSFSDGPYAETKDIVVGFSIVTAKDLDQARALATACPVLEQGGVVEIRPVMKM
jgi:hypothetical protein